MSDPVRAVPSAAAVEAAERAYWTDYGVSIHNLTAALRAAYGVDFPGASPGALTVARLAALLREWSADDDERQAGEDQLYTDDEWADALAAWLLPRLGLGAPP